MLYPNYCKLIRTKKNKRKFSFDKNRTHGFLLGYFTFWIECFLDQDSTPVQFLGKNKALFCSPPPPPSFFWRISENIITNRLEYKPESFSFKLILKVIVKDSATNFVHTFSLSSHAFLMKKSTASCFK